MPRIPRSPEGELRLREVVGGLPEFLGVWEDGRGVSLSSSYLLIVYSGFPALGFPGNTLKMQILGCDVVQWVKDLSHKH